MLGACDRVSRYEIDGLRHMGAHVADDRALHRPNIRNRRAGLEVRADFLGNVTAHADRNAHDDEVRAFSRLGVRLRDLIRDAELRDALACPRRMRSGDNSAHGALRLRGARDRRADQARPDNCEAVEQRFGHRLSEPLAPMNEVSASSTARLSSSVPMVMRSALGKPYSATRRKMIRLSCRNLSASGADLPLPVLKCNSRKLAALGVTPRPMADSASVIRARHSSLCSTARCTQA